MHSEGYSSCLVCVCPSGHAILAVRTIKSIMKDTIVLSVRFAAISVTCLLMRKALCLIINPRHACAARVTIILAVTNK